MEMQNSGFWLQGEQGVAHLNSIPEPSHPLGLGVYGLWNGGVAQTFSGVPPVAEG